MIEHLVLFKLKVGTPAGVADEIVAALTALKAQVPAIVDLSAGKNFSDRGQGFELGLTVRVKDKAGLAEYAAHPKHVDVVTRLVKPNAESVLAVDYEF